MGHKISKEQIDPGVKDHIMSFVGDIADLETEVNTDIISAVNSLMVDRVDNAENMGKLANAIGEPVTANHSVDEVVQGLGEMLSTFKANMMNSGVMVESSDKFKQLIDKIKGLTEGGGNKGIQFAMGEGNWTVSASNWGVSNEITIETNIGFIPSYIICKLSQVSVYFSNGSSSQGLDINNVFLSNLSPIDATIFDKYMSYGIPNSDIFIKNITENSFVLAETCTNVSGASSRMSGTLTEWYAIGVGEEDTTLRDSLASILEDEGVEVLPEDNMADLINKTDEEFDRKNANRYLDIISATELPATGKENQICVITDSPTDNILLTSSVADTQSEGINIYLGNSSSSDVSMGTLVPISTNGITMNYYFNRIYQGSNRLASYYYTNNTWTPLTNKYIPIFEDGAITTTELNSGLDMVGASVTDGELIFDASDNGSFYLIYSKNKINFNDISKIEVVLKKNNISYSSRIYACSSTNPSVYSNNNINQDEKVVSSTSYTTWTINTSSWTGTHYFVIQKYNEYPDLYCSIQSIRFY